MTSKERIIAALQGREVDHLPWCPFLAYWWESQPAERRERGQIAFFREIGADALLRGFTCAFSSSDVMGLGDSGYNVHDDLPGCSITRQERGGQQAIRYDTPVGNLEVTRSFSSAGDTWFVTGHPLRTREDYKTLQYIIERMKIEPCRAPLSAELGELGDDGLSAPLVSPFKKTPFQALLEHFVGTEKLVYDLTDFPSTVEETLAIMRERAREAVEISVESPAEAFITWEDSSTTSMSPTLFERYVVPDLNEWGRMIHRAGKMLFHHACGHVRALLPIIAEEDIDAIESISPPPSGDIEIWDAQRLVNQRVALIGGIEPIKLLSYEGEEFDRYIREILKKTDTRRYVLANSDSCPPAVAEWKFHRVTQILRDWRLARGSRARGGRK